MKVLLGITGSVATELTPKMAKKLIEKGHEVKVVYTEKALQFLDESYIRLWDEREEDVKGDSDEFYTEVRYSKDDPILHIELRDWADVLLICPASANTIAKMANGICDNLLTSVFRAWDFSKPVYVAGAMNTKMWTHPVTESHLETLKKWNVNIIYPTVKKLACGEYGVGGLANLDDIIAVTEGYRWKNPFCGNNVRPTNIYVPVSPHPGSFGVKRHQCYHTGVDLYADVGTYVCPFEEGEIVSVGQFTGAAVQCPWWNDTWYVSVKGKSGIICYGEIDLNKELVVGQKVEVDKTLLGTVLRVVKDPPKKPVPHHKCSMLHVELLNPIRGGLFTTPDWDIGCDKPKEILDPTPYLYLMKD